MNCPRQSIEYKGCCKTRRWAVLRWLAEVSREWARRAREWVKCVTDKILMIIWELQAGQGIWEKAVACACLRQKSNRLLGLALGWVSCLEYTWSEFSWLGRYCPLCCLEQSCRVAIFQLHLSHEDFRPLHFDVFSLLNSSAANVSHQNRVPLSTVLCLFFVAFPHSNLSCCLF